MAFDLEQWFVGGCFEIGALQKMYPLIHWDGNLNSERSVLREDLRSVIQFRHATFIIDLYNLGLGKE